MNQVQTDVIMSSPIFHAYFRHITVTIGTGLTHRPNFSLLTWLELFFMKYDVEVKSQNLKIFRRLI